MRWLLLMLATGVFAAEPFEVVVRNAITGAPLPGVELNVDSIITSTRIKTHLKQKTGDNGKFLFADLTPGRYAVRTKRLGFVDSEYPDGPVSVVRVPATDPLTIDLVPTGSMEGRVLNEDGKPVDGVEVYANRKGQPPARNVTANGGVYRIEFLAPDTYTIDVRVPFAYRSKSKVRDPDSGEIRAYPNYDAQLNVAPVTAGAILSGFDLRLRRYGMSSLAGRVFDGATREPLAGGSVGLVSAAPSLADDTYTRRKLAASGAFSFELLRPGSYYLLLYRGSAKDELPFVTPVDVDRAGLSDLATYAPPPVRIEGKLSGVGALRSIGLTGTVPGVPRRDIPVDRRGMLAMDGVPPGTWYFDLQVEPYTYVKSIRFGDQDVTQRMLRIGEGVNPPLEIEVSIQVARIIGNAPFTALNTATKVVYRSDLTNVITGLPPGEYEVSGLGQTVKLEEGETKTVQVDSRKP